MGIRRVHIYSSCSKNDTALSHSKVYNYVYIYIIYIYSVYVSIVRTCEIFVKYRAHNYIKISFLELMSNPIETYSNSVHTELRCSYARNMYLSKLVYGRLTNCTRGSTVLGFTWFA